MKKSHIKILLFVITIICTNCFAQGWDKVKIVSTKITQNIYMLKGAGGNIGLSVGEDGIFLIDDQFAPLSNKIKTAIKKIQSGPIRMIINTHWHGDHTGGNKVFGEEGAIIIAQDNVRKRLSTNQFRTLIGDTINSSPNKALPIVTFTNKVKLHVNGDELDIIHFKNAHTDGDVIVRFVKSNIVHMGDLFFNGFYPFIGIDSGGSIDGMIEAVNYIILNKIITNKTKIIPGHGPIGNLSDLIKYRNLLINVRAKVFSQIEDNKSLKEIISSHPSKKYDEKWGKYYIKPDRFVKMIYQSLTKK